MQGRNRFLSLQKVAGGGLRECKRKLASKSFDQAGLDQESVEAARLGAAGAAVEQPPAALQDRLLLDKRGVERHAGRFENDERQVGRVEHIACGGGLRGTEIDRVNGVVGGEEARILLRDLPRNE